MKKDKLQPATEREKVLIADITELERSVENRDNVIRSLRMELNITHEVYIRILNEFK